MGLIIAPSLTASAVAVLINVVRVAGTIHSSHQYLEGWGDDQAHALLVPELFNKEGELESDRIAKRIWQERPLLK